jgi:AraC-like DNA-binding protein
MDSPMPLELPVTRARLPRNGCWLRALVDEQIGKALTLIHAHPNHAWTVAELASQVGMSRSAFSSRFTMLVGGPPLAYVTRWRMHKAGNMMRQGKVSMAEISRLVGYESEGGIQQSVQARNRRGPWYVSSSVIRRPSLIGAEQRHAWIVLLRRVCSTAPHCAGWHSDLRPRRGRAARPRGPSTRRIQCRSKEVP